MRILFTILLFSTFAEAQIPIVNGWKQTDPDAAAFIAASGITDATQKSAINKLVLDLKAASIWTKYAAIYPFVGGTADTHKWNLKDPRDLDAAFRLTFSGTWSHSSTGADPNGTTAYANTYLIPNTTLALNSISIQYYSTDNTAIGGYDIGSVSSVGTSRLNMVIKHSTGGNPSYSALNTVDISFGNIVSDSRGLFTGSRTASNATAFYKNATSLATGTTASSTLSTTVIYIGAGNENGTAGLFSNHNCAFAGILNSGLTSGEVTSSYNAIQTFQTSLGRQQ